MKYAHSTAPRRLVGLLMLVATAWMPAAWAAPVVTSKLEVRQLVIASGHEQLKPATAARPGDLLQYRANYTNSGDQPAGHLLASLPVPAGTSLLASGIDPAGAQASLDGTHFEPMPLMHQVTGKDGKVRQEPVPMSAIRALRWDLGTLAPRQTRSVQIRVHVNTPINTTAAGEGASSPR